MKKNLVSFLLVIITTFLIVPVFLPQKVNAAVATPETYELDGSLFKIEHAGDTTTVTEYIDDNKISTTSYDRSEELVTIVDDENTETEYKLDDLRDEYSLYKESVDTEYAQEELGSKYSLSTGPEFSTMSTNVNLKSRFSPYRYVKSGSRYTLTIVDGRTRTKTVNYSTARAGYLNSFRRNIVDIRSGEMAVIGALGIDMAAAVIGGLFTGGIGTVIALVGTLPAILAAGNTIIRASNRAKADYYAI